jgi:hypothetical protein
MRRSRKALQALEDEVTRLRDEVGSLKAGDDEPVSRRHLLRAAGTAVAAGLGLAVADEVLNASPASAADVIIVGTSSGGSAAVAGTNTGTGIGVRGEISNAASTNAAVYGVTNGAIGAALWGRSTNGSSALYGESTDATSSTDAAYIRHYGTGTVLRVENQNSQNVKPAFQAFNEGFGSASDAISGHSYNGVGVRAISDIGTAIVGQAGTGPSLRLVPMTSTLPTGTRSVGEVFIDLNGNLFMCKVAGPAPAAWMRVGYNPIEPVRIVDTRLAGLPDKMTPGSELLVSIIGVAGVPAGATAVTLNVTAVDATANGGFLSLYPATSTYSSGSPPSFSNVNFNAGQTVANSATIKLSPPGTATAGKIKVFNALGNTDVILDVAGFFS